MSPTYRSFAELPRAPRDRHATTPVRLVKDASRTFSPSIPCGQCGRPMPYADAVPRKLGPGHYAFAHPEGDCRPTDVRRWRAQRAAGGMELLK